MRGSSGRSTWPTRTPGLAAAFALGGSRAAGSAFHEGRTSHTFVAYAATFQICARYGAMRHPRFVFAGLVLALAVVTPARAADTLLAEVDEPTPIRAYADVQVWSTFDGTVYRLTIRRAGAIATLPVAPSRRPFDVDVGPDRAGRPLLVYARCRRDRVDASGAAAGSRGCDIVAYSLVGGSGERPMRGVNTAAADEFAPSIWRGRIAFARRVRGSSETSIFTRRLDVPRSERSQRLPGARSVIELDLQGSRLGEIVGLGRAAEVRLVGVSDRRVRRLQRTASGRVDSPWLGSASPAAISPGD